MIRGTTLPRQTLPLLAAAALLLPAIIALAVWLSGQQDEQRRSVEREALETARKVAALSDAEISADTRVLQVIAGSPMLRQGDFTAYGERENETHAVIALIAKAFVEMDPYEIWGDGQQDRNFTYVGDINLDGAINGDDYFSIDSQIGAQGDPL